MVRTKMKRIRRVRRPDARENARPPRVLVKHASGSRALMRAPFDLRSTVGRAYQQRVHELVAHIGGEANAVQRTLIDHAARLHLVTRLAWEEIGRSGALRDGAPSPALDTYRRAAAEERSVLLTLGLNRVAREIPRLADVVTGRTL